MNPKVGELEKHDRRCSQCGLNATTSLLPPATGNRGVAIWFDLPTDHFARWQKVRKIRSVERIQLPDAPDCSR